MAQSHPPNPPITARPHAFPPECFRSLEQLCLLTMTLLNLMLIKL